MSHRKRGPGRADLAAVSRLPGGRMQGLLHDFTYLVYLQLAADGHRNFVDKTNVVPHFEMRDPVAAEGANLVRVGTTGLVQLNPGGNLFTDGGARSRCFATAVKTATGLLAHVPGTRAQ